MKSSILMRFKNW